MKQEKHFLKKKISEVDKEIERLQSKKKLIEQKIVEEDMEELVLTMKRTVVRTNEMVDEWSKGIIKQGKRVSDEPKLKEFEMRFVRIGSKMFCIMFNEIGEEVGRGVCKCHYEDEFNYVKAINIAESRALQDELKRREVNHY
ncbi:MAG: hypothetical protein ACRCX8_05150 [Sarcina sp.]